MDDNERNRIFDKFWPYLKPVIFRIWKKYSTVRRIGTLDDVQNEAAVTVLNAITQFIPAKQYDSPGMADGHMKAYLIAAINRGLIYRSRCSSLMKVSAHAAASVFAGEFSKDSDGPMSQAWSAVHCQQLDTIPVTIAKDTAGDEDHTVSELQVALARLQPDERDIIGKFWGLDGDRVSLEDLATANKLTRNAARRRVRAIESKLKLMMTRE
jgi:hypothetical protein